MHPQNEGFTDHAVWDFEHTPPEHYPLLLHYPYFDLYRKQVVKQADLVLALHLRGDAFTLDEKTRDFEYYEQFTVRDSSLSAATQAVIAAEVGHLELAYDYFAEAALMDLQDHEHNTRSGLHMAAIAGAWIGAVMGFGGMRDHGGKLTFRPRLPGAVTRLSFRSAVPRPKAVRRADPGRRDLHPARGRAARAAARRRGLHGRHRRAGVQADHEAGRAPGAVAAVRPGADAAPPAAQGHDPQPRKRRSAVWVIRSTNGSRSRRPLTHSTEPTLTTVPAPRR